MSAWQLMVWLTIWVGGGLVFWSVLTTGGSPFARFDRPVRFARVRSGQDRRRRRRRDGAADRRRSVPVY